MHRIVNALPTHLLPIGITGSIHVQEIALEHAKRWATIPHNPARWEALADEETLRLLGVEKTPFPEWPHWGTEDEILLCQPGREMRFFLVWLSKR